MMIPRTFIALLFAVLLCGRAEAQDDFKTHAAWITVPYAEDSLRRPCPIFLKAFRIDKQVKSARLYITALGLYEARINGRRVGRAYLAPGFTNYGRRLFYQVYEVGPLLARQNRLSVMLGDGWYRGTFRNLETDTQNNNYGRSAGLLASLEITYADGIRQWIGTGEDWRCAPGQVRYSGLYDGELQDTYTPLAPFRPVKRLAAAVPQLIRSVVPPVTAHERFKAKVLPAEGPERLLDFGQNLAGFVRISVRGNVGDSLVVRHAEMLDKGALYRGNLRNAKATDVYILNGRQQVLEPHFTYHGFRYAGLTLYRGGQPVDLPLNWSAEALALYSDLRVTGTFSCSYRVLNRLQSNIEWSLKSNFLDIPTDCPQRSERLGWTADAQVFCATASFLRDTRSFYEKWLADLSSEQGANGALPNFIPTSSPYRPDVYGVAGWGDAAAIMPWHLYEVYGDREMLARQYPSMKRWVDYMRSVSVNGLFQNKGYGDWYATGPQTDVALIGQCFYAASAAILVKAATVLGKKDDAADYAALLPAIKARFRETYHLATQTAFVLALQFDLLPEAGRQAAADSLVRLIHDNGNRLATGFLGTPYLLPVLSRFGYTNIAYDLLLQKACPSWLYPLTKGATTIWERWDALRPDGTLQECSYNHYAYGAVGQWLYEHVAGIRPLEPAYRTFLLAPETGGTLRWAKAEYRCAYGKITSAWQKKNDTIVFDLRVPPGTTAVFCYGGTRRLLIPGKYHFTQKINPE